MGKPKIVAVMPVKGREELFPITIKRLYQQEGVDMKVVALCDTYEELAILEGCGVSTRGRSAWDSLGEKWQTGVEIARQYDPDAIMIVGSGNWFTNGWCSTLCPLLGSAEHPLLDGYDVVGSEEMYVYHIRQRDRILLHWGGYYYTSRIGDMLGAGRMISRIILDKVDWQIYDTSLNSGLDKSMTKILRRADAKFYTMPPMMGEKILKVSSYKWENINPFTALWNSPRCKKAQNPDEILKDFPEAKTLLA